jgi:hypothetical protein
VLSISSRRPRAAVLVLAPPGWTALIKARMSLPEIHERRLRLDQRASPRSIVDHDLRTTP